MKHDAEQPGRVGSQRAGRGLYGSVPNRRTLLYVKAMGGPEPTPPQPQWKVSEDEGQMEAKQHTLSLSLSLHAQRKQHGRG